MPSALVFEVIFNKILYIVKTKVHYTINNIESSNAWLSSSVYEPNAKHVICLPCSYHRYVTI